MQAIVDQELPGELEPFTDLQMLSNANEEQDSPKNQTALIPMKARSERRAHACVACRRKRSKCKGGPPCDNCVNSGSVCQYAEQKPRGPRKRKPIADISFKITRKPIDNEVSAHFQVGDYLQQFEIQLGSVFQLPTPKMPTNFSMSHDDASLRQLNKQEKQYRVLLFATLACSSLIYGKVANYNEFLNISKLYTRDIFDIIDLDSALCLDRLAWAYILYGQYNEARLYNTIVRQMLDTLQRPKSHGVYMSNMCQRYYMAIGYCERKTIVRKLLRHTTEDSPYFQHTRMLLLHTHIEELAHRRAAIDTNTASSLLSLLAQVENVHNKKTRHLNHSAQNDRLDMKFGSYKAIINYAIGNIRAAREFADSCLKSLLAMSWMQTTSPCVGCIVKYMHIVHSSIASPDLNAVIELERTTIQKFATAYPGLAHLATGDINGVEGALVSSKWSRKRNKDVKSPGPLPDRIELFWDILTPLPSYSPDSSINSFSDSLSPSNSSGSASSRQSSPTHPSTISSSNAISPSHQYQHALDMATASIYSNSIYVNESITTNGQSSQTLFVSDNNAYMSQFDTPAATVTNSYYEIPNSLDEINQSIGVISGSYSSALNSVAQAVPNIQEIAYLLPAQITNDSTTDEINPSLEFNSENDQFNILI